MGYIPERGYCKKYVEREEYVFDPKVFETPNAPKWLGIKPSPGSHTIVTIDPRDKLAQEAKRWFRDPANHKYILQKTRVVTCTMPNGNKYRSVRSTRFLNGKPTYRYYSYIATDKHGFELEKPKEEGYPAELETPGQREIREYGSDQEKYAGRSKAEMIEDERKRQERDLRDKIAMVKEGLKTQLYIAGLDIAGIFDPTPISDGLSCAASLKEGDKAGATLSCGAMAPGTDVVMKPLKIAYNIKKFKKLIKKLKELMKKVCKVECQRRKAVHLRNKASTVSEKIPSKIMNKDIR